MADEAKKKRALALWEEGQSFHQRGSLKRAIALYSESIAVCPTAEAHTFRGWAYSFLGRIEEAIAECKVAIEVDPSFGNPYNDIGSYLMKLGEFDEAVEWLEKAKSATRTEVPHFPYMNLARLYARKGQLAAAIEELEGALKLCPEEQSCRVMIERLRGKLN